jgi:hypothetical protein
VALDPTNGQSVPVRGRAFIGGRTYAGTATGSPPVLALQKWVIADSNGKPIVNPDWWRTRNRWDWASRHGERSRLPGRLAADEGQRVRVRGRQRRRSHLHETFPANRQIRIRCTTAVRSTKGKSLGRQALGSATVGPDTLSPKSRSRRRRTATP